MRVGLYVLSLYCDQCDDRGDAESAQFTGKSRQDCDSQKWRAGWARRRNKDYCPKCSKKLAKELNQ